MRQVDPLVGGGGHAEGVPLFQVGKDLRILFLKKNNFTVVLINFTVVMINFTVVIIILLQLFPFLRFGRILEFGLRTWY